MCGPTDGLTVPGTMKFNGRAHGKDEEKTIFLAVLLGKGAVDPKHVGWKRLDVELALGSSYQLRNGGVLMMTQLTAEQAYAGDPPLGIGGIDFVGSHLWLWGV